jgi:hypothetical protein
VDILDRGGRGAQNGHDGGDGQETEADAESAQSVDVAGHKRFSFLSDRTGVRPLQPLTSSSVKM